MLKVGIVGLPNVGKSTLFNALLKKQQALAANYPFATIEPNVGIVPVPDPRLKQLAQVIEQTEKVNPPIVPATIEFVDIAGIVEGASKGEGLGNQFLSHIREVDLIAHVIRDFDDGDVVQTGKDLVSDYETILNELVFKDLESLENQQIKLKKDRSKEGVAKLALIEKLIGAFNEGKRAAEVVTEAEAEIIADLFLLTMKPRILVVNVSEDELNKSDDITQNVATKLSAKPEDIVVISAKIESEIAQLNDEEAEIFMADLGVSESGLERLVRTAYHRCGLISFLTAGAKEVRAWTIIGGMTAPEAAGVIHTDFIKKFIKAEVISFEDFTSLGGVKNSREAGKLRLEGRDYVMKDGDVVEFKIGA